jgi:peroxiredoxin
MKKTLLFILAILVYCTGFSQEKQYSGGLKKADKAPDFTLMGPDGKKYNLEELLKKGPVVLVFYRGQWCPYCNKTLSNLTDSLSFMESRGASVMAVSPETPTNILKTISKTKSTFPVLSDSGMQVMKAYKVQFEVDESTIKKYKGYGIDFNEANGSNGTNLPVPATYVIGQNGIIRYVFYNTDYRQRATVKDILAHM